MPPRLVVQHSCTGFALLAIAMVIAACTTQSAPRSGWVGAARMLGDVALCFEPIGQPIANEPAGLHDAVRLAFLESRDVSSLTEATNCAGDGESAEAQTIAYFSLRTRDRAVNAQLFPWPSITLQSELRYRLRLIDPRTGKVWTDTDRSLMRHGLFAFRDFDAEAISVDVQLFLASLRTGS